MKKLILAALLAAGVTAAHAGGARFYRHHHHHGWHGWHAHPSFSFHVGAYPSHSYYYPAYTYTPVYGSSYAYSRPNYAISGTLFGALAGGLIGHSIDRQGWEGAGIGAAAGLVLGSIAEHNARAQEQAVYQAPAVYQQSSAATAPGA